MTKSARSLQGLLPDTYPSRRWKEETIDLFLYIRLCCIFLVVFLGRDALYLLPTQLDILGCAGLADCSLLALNQVSHATFSVVFFFMSFFNEHSI